MSLNSATAGTVGARLVTIKTPFSPVSALSFPVRAMEVLESSSAAKARMRVRAGVWSFVFIVSDVKIGCYLSIRRRAKSDVTFPGRLFDEWRKIPDGDRAILY